MTELTSSETIPAISELLQQRLAKYKVAPAALQVFGTYIDQASKYELYRLNARRVAVNTGLELSQAISIAALSVREGIFDLLWEFMCMHCNMEMQKFVHLNFVAVKSTICQACQETTDPDFDHSIQVTFSLNPGIRELHLPSLEVRMPNGLPPSTLREFIAAVSPEQMQILDEA